MKVTKMHGIGNDYIYIDCFKQQMEDKSALSIKLSHRHFAVGGDGVIYICPSEKADFFMDMYNADGSRGLMCGNGIRCVGKYVYDNGLTDKTVLKIETLSGIKTLWLNIEDGKVKTVRVGMGKASFREDYIKKIILVAGRTWEVTALSVGNPHLVTFIDEDIDSLDLERIGPFFEKHEDFPEGVNTEFVNILPDGSLKMRVWERGSGETLACGTGATALTATAIRLGYCEKSAIVRLKGGELYIEQDENGELFMTGEAVTVFDAEVYI
ncbi:diaminopimelate epimerase [Clostridiaceae bacterium OttesenSCG-928-D20]|nr:diaminopimelate epimerase [Clostridiaceae bacterium OttesenSCG-928-D20]